MHEDVEGHEGPEAHEPPGDRGEVEESLRIRVPPPLKDGLAGFADPARIERGGDGEGDQDAHPGEGTHLMQSFDQLHERTPCLPILCMFIL